MADKIDDESNDVEALAVSSSVSFGDGTQALGNVAGRDIIITSSGFESRADELADILELRAEKIQKSLANFYQYAPVRDYLAKFRELHFRHVQSLRGKQLLLAHEILLEIHRLSYELEREEFWTNHRINTPDTRYMLRSDAFQRGHLICEYVADDMHSYSEKYPSSKGYGRDINFFDESKSSLSRNVNQAEVYTIVMQTARPSEQDCPESL